MSDFIDKFNEEKEVDLQENKYLTFLLDNRVFAFSISTVYEIIEVEEATPIPEFPDYVKGIINCKGRVVPVIDLRIRFQLPEKEYDERTCIVICNICNVDIGFVVDTVLSVTEISQDKIAPSPAITTDKVTRYIAGIAKLDNLVIILDGKKILDDKGLELVSNIK